MMRFRPRGKGAIYLSVVLAALLCAAAVALANSSHDDGATTPSTVSRHHWRQCEGVTKAPTNRINAHNVSCKIAQDIVNEYLSSQPELGGLEPHPRGFICNQRPIGGQKDGFPGPYRVACDRTQDHRIAQIRYFWG